MTKSEPIQKRIPITATIHVDLFAEQDHEARAAAAKMDGFTLEWVAVITRGSQLDEDEYLRERTRWKVLVAEELIDGDIGAEEMRSIGHRFTLRDREGNVLFGGGGSSG